MYCAELRGLRRREDCGCLRCAWASWRAIGIRPVPTWNSTEAEPTPIRLGPRPSTPWALRPWQVMQLLSNSSLPSLRGGGELAGCPRAKAPGRERGVDAAGQRERGEQPHRRAEPPARPAAARRGPPGATARADRRRRWVSEVMSCVPNRFWT